MDELKEFHARLVETVLGCWDEEGYGFVDVAGICKVPSHNDVVGGFPSLPVHFRRRGK